MDNTLNIKNYADNLKKINKKNYITSFILLVTLYLVLAYTIVGDDIFSYKAGLYINILIYVLFALSLNVVSGVMGELNLGHAGFISIGAYSASILSIFIQKYSLNSNLHLVVVTVFGGIVAGLSGLFLSSITLRLRGDYLAIITLAFGEIIKYIIQNINLSNLYSNKNSRKDTVFIYLVYIIAIHSYIFSKIKIRSIFLYF